MRTARGFMIEGAGLLLLFVMMMILLSKVAQNPWVLSVVTSLGYLGVLLVGIVTGFNIIISIPGSVFVPLFLAGGLTMSGIVLALALGTTIADIIGFYIGVFGKKYAQDMKYIWYRRLSVFVERFRYLAIPLVFLYASFVPFPNEALLIPLALLGFKLRYLLLPLLLGNFVHNALFAWGAVKIFEWWG